MKEPKFQNIIELGNYINSLSETDREEYMNKWVEDYNESQKILSLAPPEPCPYCKSAGTEFCGPCVRCGEPGHVEAFMMCSLTACAKCKDQIMEETISDFGGGEWQEEDEVTEGKLPWLYIPKIRVKRLTDTAKLPTKAHPTDLGYDLYADEEVVLQGGFTRKIQTGIAIGFPEGWGGLIKDRSSMASKGLVTSGGVIDQAYIGEISIILTYNTDVDTNYRICKGDKIAQLVLTQVTNFPIEEVDELGETDRGTKGFGSSGH